MLRGADFGARRLERAGAVLGLALAFLPGSAAGGALASVEPARISAGSFYDGATIEVRGSIGERSQVAIRVTGPLEHHAFNRRGKIGGLIWGGIAHVNFEHAPSLYAVYASAALTAVAQPAVRERLKLGYAALAAGIDLSPAQPDKAAVIDQFVRLKESEGLYRLAPGAVRLADAEGGRRGFEVAVPIPATAPPGDLEVSVFELVDGAVVAEETARVPLERVGMPAYLFRLAHERSTLFGLLAASLLLGIGLGVDFLGSARSKHGRHPAVVVLAELTRGLDDLLTSRHPLRSPKEIELVQAKYRLFRDLLTVNSELLELLSELEEESSWTSFSHVRVRMGIRALFDGTADMVRVLNELTGNRYFDLANVVASLRSDVSSFLGKALGGPESDPLTGAQAREESRLTLQMKEIGTKTAGLAGGKAVNLARLECDLGLRVPASFVVTTEAYREFLEADGLAGQLRTILAPARLDAADDFRRRCELAQDLVRRAPVPPAVVEAIGAAYRAAGIPASEGLAVRSSAPGEGSELSFAGQFETCLNVPAPVLVDAWKRVVCSRFAPGAVFYRRAAGLAEVDMPMAVLVQQMVAARASGVMYTRRPDAPSEPAVLITAGAGLGPEVSVGVASSDRFVLSRQAPHAVLERHLARKPIRLASAQGGGLAKVAVEAEEQLQASLSEEEAAHLAAMGLSAERYFGGPQDIEWVIDAQGRAFMLQARPLSTDSAKAPREEAALGAPLLLQGGQPIWSGRAVGPVHLARTPAEEEQTPTGALLVVPQLLPDCVRLLPRVCGIVVERGSVTGHAASLLREFRMPSLFGVANALETLMPGQVVSLDVASRSVFSGALWPELRGQLPVAVHGHRTTGLPGLLAGKITKLSGSAFMGTWACQSLHDVIRFAHEMAIQSMFDIGDRLLESPAGAVKKLDCPPPLSVHLVDLGGGLRREAKSKQAVKVEEITCAPFRGLWSGLSDPNFELHLPERPASLGYMLATTMSTSGNGSPNYACMTDSYLNLSSRQAFHYAVVDSFLSDNQNNNHIRLRLRGGGAAAWQRRLRAEFVAEVLRMHHFRVSVAGDVLSAWVRGLDREMGAAKLAMIGHLLRFLTRLDRAMTDETQVKRNVEAFAAAEAAAAMASHGGTALA